MVRRTSRSIWRRTSVSFRYACQWDVGASLNGCGNGPDANARTATRGQPARRATPTPCCGGAGQRSLAYVVVDRVGSPRRGTDHFVAKEVVQVAAAGEGRLAVCGPHGQVAQQHLPQRRAQPLSVRYPMEADVLDRAHARPLVLQGRPACCRPVAARDPTPRSRAALSVPVVHAAAAAGRARGR